MKLLSNVGQHGPQRRWKNTCLLVDLNHRRLLCFSAIFQGNALESLNNSQLKSKWPPTEEIVEANDEINTNLFNLVLWIVHPRAQIANNGRIMIPKSKTQNELQITQNITALLPNTLLSKDQVILSLTMHRETGSSDVVNTLHRLEHGISYSETLLVEDK